MIQAVQSSLVARGWIIINSQLSLLKLDLAELCNTWNRAFQRCHCFQHCSSCSWSARPCLPYPDKKSHQLLFSNPPTHICRVGLEPPLCVCPGLGSVWDSPWQLLWLWQGILGCPWGATCGHQRGAWGETSF